METSLDLIDELAFYFLVDWQQSTEQPAFVGQPHCSAAIGPCSGKCHGVAVWHSAGPAQGYKVRVCFTVE